MKRKTWYELHEPESGLNVVNDPLKRIDDIYAE